MLVSERAKQTKPYEPIYWNRKYAFYTRVIALTIMVPLFIYYTGQHGPGRFIYLTVQSEVMMLIYTAISIAHYLDNGDETKFLTRLKGMITHLTLSVQFLVVIFYWAILPAMDWQRI